MSGCVLFQHYFRNKNGDGRILTLILTEKKKGSVAGKDRYMYLTAIFF